MVMPHKAVSADVEQNVGGFERFGTHTLEHAANPAHLGEQLVRFPPHGCKQPKPFCRICWESKRTQKDDPMVRFVLLRRQGVPDPLLLTTPPSRSFASPCGCTGTQKWVHLRCLKSWQQSVLDNAATLGDERAYRCGVCKSLYSIPPASLRVTGYRTACFRIFRLILVIACLFALYCSIDSPYMWPLIGFVGLIVPAAAGGSREGGARPYQVLLCLSLLFFIALLRLFVPVIMNAEWFKYQASNPASLYAADLRPGSILLSNDNVMGHSSTFSNSVVLLFSHTATNGSQGVILNQRILSRAETLESGWCVLHIASLDCFCFSSLLRSQPCSQSRSESRSHLLSLSSFDPASDLIRECIQHHSQPSHDEDFGVSHYFGGPKFALERLVVLHTFPKIAGSREIVLPGDGDEVSIFIGGLMSDVLAESFLRRKTGDMDSPVWVFHGISSWSPAQLDDEIEAGAWTVKPGSLDDLVFFGMFE